MTTRNPIFILVASVFLNGLSGCSTQDIVLLPNKTLPQYLATECPVEWTQYTEVMQITPGVYHEPPPEFTPYTSLSADVLTMEFSDISLEPFIYSVDTQDVPEALDEIERRYPGEELPDPLLLTGCVRKGWIGTGTATATYNGETYSVSGDIQIIDGSGDISSNNSSVSFVVGRRGAHPGVFGVGTTTGTPIALPGSLVIDGQVIWFEAI